MPTATFTIGFATSTDRSSGSITYTDTTDWAGQSIDPADVEIAWGFKGPDGETYRQAVIGQAGNVFPSVSLSASAGLPRALGVVQTGDYIVFAEVSVTAGPEFSVPESTHNLCTDFPTFVLTPVIDCLAGIVSVRDDTGWTQAGFTVNTRSMVLQYPLVSQHANITSAGPTVTTGGLPIYRGTWATEAAWNVTRGNYTVDISGTLQFVVSCSSGSCERWCVIDSVYKQYLSAKANGEDWQQKQLQLKINTLVTLATLMDRQESCGKSDILNTLGNAFAQLTSDCKCDCSCDGDGTLITPAWQSGGGSNVELVEGDYILITNVGDTWTISVDPSLLAIINALYNTEVTSTDGSVRITASNPAPNTVLYDLSVTEPKDSIRFLVDVNPFSGTPLVVVTGSVEIVGSTFEYGPITFTATGNSFYIIDGFISAGTPVFRPEVFMSKHRHQPNAYGTVMRYDGTILPIARYDQGGTNFIVGFEMTSGNGAIPPGTMYPLFLYQPYLVSFQVEVVITAV